MSPDLKDIFDDAGRTPPHGRGYDADEVVHRGARIRTRRRLLTGAATLGVAAVVVGGSIALIGQPLDKGTAIQPGDGASTSAAPATPSDTPSSATPTTDASPRPSSNWQPCRVDDVTLTLSDSGVAAGTAYSVILIKAKPDVTCTVEGFAYVEATRATGDAIGPAAESGEASGEYPVTGSTVASFLVGIANSDNYDPAVCHPVPATSLNVALNLSSLGTNPIDQRIAVPLPDGVTVCSGNVSSFGNQLIVTPIVTGPDGQ
jgi:hypothetical protein